MSDGPYRSLPRRKMWKEFAKRGELDAWSIESMSEALIPALAGDWRLEMPSLVPRSLMVLLASPQGTLLLQESIQALKPDAAGSGLAARLIEWTLHALKLGFTGVEALVEGTSNLLEEQADKGARQIEDHYRREDGVRSASHIRSRMEDAIDAAPIRDMARALLKIAPQPMPSQPIKQQGIDEGPGLDHRA